MKEKVINLVYELVDEIKNSETYIRLLELKDLMDTDTATIKLITDFNEDKTKYNEVSKYGEYHPDLKEVKIALSKSKEALFANETISEYKKLEKEVQKILDNISRRIARSVSLKVKHPNEMGLINKH
ncbi:MAG: YlbF family regulator [Candidatus Izimaplasma sp.]|nr:YlbF family regulator [Candidatus Izimaplasma bacterium]